MNTTTNTSIATMEPVKSTTRQVWGRSVLSLVGMICAAVMLTLGASAGLAQPAEAATSSISVVGPTATCTMNFYYQDEVDAQAYLLHQVGVTAHYQMDLLLWYGGAWHDVQHTAQRATTGNLASAYFTPTNGYTWSGYTAKVRLFLWNNYGAGWQWYYYDSASCVVP